MNSFQILDSNNEPVSMFKLDMLACKFWNVESDPKQYAKPTYNIIGNWFDVVGWYISYQGRFTSGWANVKLSLVMNTIEHDVYTIIMGSEREVKVSKTIKYLKPYFDLIDFWDKLGYKPKQIKD